MPESRDIKTLVRMVADGLLRRDPESAVVQKLIAAGISANEAPAIYRAVKTACQQGVQSVITGGISAQDGPPKDPLLAEAYRVGQASMRGAARTFWLQRAFILFVIVAAVAAIAWFFRR